MNVKAMLGLLRGFGLNIKTELKLVKFKIQKKINTNTNFYLEFKDVTI